MNHLVVLWKMSNIHIKIKLTSSINRNAEVAKYRWILFKLITICILKSNLFGCLLWVVSPFHCFGTNYHKSHILQDCFWFHDFMHWTQLRSYFFVKLLFFGISIGQTGDVDLFLTKRNKHGSLYFAATIHK